MCDALSSRATLGTVGKHTWGVPSQCASVGEALLTSATPHKCSQHTNSPSAACGHVAREQVERKHRLSSRITRQFKQHRHSACPGTRLHLLNAFQAGHGVTTHHMALPGFAMVHSGALCIVRSMRGLQHPPGSWQAFSTVLFVVSACQDYPNSIKCELERCESKLQASDFLGGCIAACK